MNLFELSVKIKAEDTASATMKKTQGVSETLANKIKVLSAQFEAAQKNVDKLAKEFNESVNKAGATDKATQELAKKLSEAEKEAGKFAKELDAVQKEAEQAEKALDGYNKELGETDQQSEKAEKGVSSFGKKIGEVSEWIIAKGQLIADAIKEGGKALIDLGKQAINSFAEYEQLAGGAAKIFDEMSQTKILDDAKNAYKELGLSANQYLSVINDVGATFSATMGDEAGYEAAKTGLKAISDYASGTGKNVDELSSKFTLITRSTSSYQSIADQFSGILPATSAGFLEQAQAAGILSDSYTKLTEVPIDEYQAAVSKMLEQGVADLGLANNTVLESETTISGSLAAMKSAADNFLVALIDENANVGESFQILAESVGSFLDNIIPKIWTFVGSLGPIGPLLAGITAALGAFQVAASISKVVGLAAAAFDAYRKANEGATVAQWLMNAAMNANPIVLVVTLISGLVAALIVLWNTNEGFKNALINAWLAIKNTAVFVWESIVNFFTEDIPNAFNTVITFVKNNWQSLLLLITNPIAGALKLLYDLNPKFREWVNNLLSNMKSWVSGMVSIGQAIVNGVWSGIQSMASTFTAKVQSFFSGIVNSVKRALGIHSPSRVFRDEIGKQMAAGLGLGWEDGFNDVKSEIEDSLNFNDASIGINSSIRKVGAEAAGMAYGGTSIGNITIYIDGANYSDEQSLAEAIAETIQDMTDRRAAVYA